MHTPYLAAQSERRAVHPQQRSSGGAARVQANAYPSWIWSSLLVFSLLLSATATGCASTDPRGPVTLRFPEVAAPDLDLLEDRIHERVNQVRLAHGLPVLIWDKHLQWIAREYAVRVRNADDLTHTLHGSMLNERYSSAGYACKIAVPGTNTSLTGGENLAMIPQIPQIIQVTGEPDRPYTIRSLEQIVDATVDGWMNSPGHRENMLHPLWRHEGIGVVIDSEHRLWITQNFC